MISNESSSIEFLPHDDVDNDYMIWKLVRVGFDKLWYITSDMGNFSLNADGRHLDLTEDKGKVESQWIIEKTETKDEYRIRSHKNDHYLLPEVINSKNMMIC